MGSWPRSGRACWPASRSTPDFARRTCDPVLLPVPHPRERGRRARDPGRGLRLPPQCRTRGPRSLRAPQAPPVGFTLGSLRSPSSGRATLPGSPWCSGDVQPTTAETSCRGRASRAAARRDRPTSDERPAVTRVFAPRRRGGPAITARRARCRAAELPGIRGIPRPGIPQSARRGPLPLRKSSRLAHTSASSPPAPRGRPGSCPWRDPGRSIRPSTRDGRRHSVALSS